MTKTEAPLFDVQQLGNEWHGAGTVTNSVLDALVQHVSALDPGRTIETGTGRTTLLLSHLSDKHTVFTMDDSHLGGSLGRVKESPLLRSDTVDFVLGPTQQTILGYEFDGDVDLAYLDGPHAWPFPDLEYFAVYPHLRTGALLVIDDVNLPTIANMFDVLRRDDMYDVVEVVDNTAFLRRTDAPTLDPAGDGWWKQGYNSAGQRFGHLSVRQRAIAASRAAAPERVKEFMRNRR